MTYQYTAEQIDKLSTPYDMGDFNTKTLSELKLIDRDMYQLAIEANIFDIAASIAMHQGVCLKYETVSQHLGSVPRHEFIDPDSGLTILRYFTGANNRNVDIYYSVALQAHQVESRFAVEEKNFVRPGEWVRQLIRLYTPIEEAARRELEQVRIALLARMQG